MKNWKRYLALMLSVLLTLGVLSGCSKENAEQSEPETTVPVATQPPEEAKVLKVLTLGHSLAVDTGHMLNLVCATEGIGEYEEIVIGTLYYSGCQLWRHVQYLQANSPEYRLYMSSTKTPDQPPITEDGVTMESALRRDYWDIIVMQGGAWEVAKPDDMGNGNIRIIQNYVLDNVYNPNVIFAWHMPWALPTDMELLNMYPYEPNTHRDNYVTYGTNRENFYLAIVQCVKDYIMTDETFQFLIPTGTAMQNAWSSYMEDKDIHRDYAHATDMARVMTSYVWYCKLMGIEKLEEIKLDAIPKAFLKSTEDKTVDRVLTEMEKAVMLESINNALANPLEMTQSQYTVAP